MPDPTFHSVIEDTAQLRWPTGVEVRRSARRSTVRSAVTGAVVVAVTVGLAAGVGLMAAGGDGRPPGPDTADVTGSASAPVTAAPSSPAGTPNTSPGGSAPAGPPDTSSPTRRPLTAVPRSALLRPSDAGPGDWHQEDEDSEDADEGDWAFDAIIGYCPAAPAGVAGLVDRRLNSIRRSLNEPGDGVLQSLAVYRPGQAGADYDRYRAAAIACARHRSNLGGTDITVRIVAEGFAGPRSMLVESTSEHGRGLWFLGADGDLMTQLAFNPETTEYGRLLGERAMARMCAAQGSC